MAEYKQVLVVNDELKMSKGKMAAQASHASVESLLRSHKDDISKWRSNGMKKVVLKAKDKQELFQLKTKAEDLGLACAIISDAGMTELPPGSVTCLGIGPDKEEKIDLVTGSLKMA